MTIQTAHNQHHNFRTHASITTDKGSFFYTYKPSYKGIFHKDHLPASFGMIAALIMFAGLSLQLALTPFVAIEKQTIAYQQQTERYLASINVEPSKQYLAANENYLDQNSTAMVLGTSDSNIFSNIWESIVGFFNKLIGKSENKEAEIYQSSISCNNIVLSISPTNIKVGDTVTLSISGDASTWISDNFGNGISQCGDWNFNSNLGGTINCKAVQAGSYTWSHYWKHCIASFDNCSSQCSASLNYSIASACTPTATWEYSEWSACVGACGGGTGIQTRTGTCLSSCGGICGEPILSQSCVNNNPCDCTPINGTWSYSAWSECSGACGGGTGIQTRAGTCSATCNGTCGTPVLSQACVNNTSCGTGGDPNFIISNPQPSMPEWCSKEYPSRPTGLVATTGEAFGTVHLRWNPSNPVTHYTVTFGEEWMNFKHGSPNIGNTDQYIVTGLKPGVKYYFVITAVNDCASSGYSDGASAIAKGYSRTVSTAKPSATTTPKASMKATASPKATAEATSSGIPYDNLQQASGSSGLYDEWNYTQATTEFTPVPETPVKRSNNFLLTLAKILPWFGMGILIVLGIILVRFIRGGSSDELPPLPEDMAEGEIEAADTGENSTEMVVENTEQNNNQNNQEPLAPPFT